MSALAWRQPDDDPCDGLLPIEAGDLIRTGSNSHPHYRVIAVSEDRAWIRDVQHGTDHVVRTTRCQRIDGSARAEEVS